MKKFSFLILSLALTGCMATTQSYAPSYELSQNYDSVFKNTTVEKDNYSKSRWYYAPAQQCSPKTQASCSASLRHDGKNLYQIYVDYRTIGWSFLRSAKDSDGKNIEFVLIDRETLTDTDIGFLISEVFALNLSKSYLLKHKDSGIDIKVYGQKANSFVKIEPYYIKAFLDRINQD